MRYLIFDAEEKAEVCAVKHAIAEGYRTAMGKPKKERETLYAAMWVKHPDKDLWAYQWEGEHGQVNEVDKLTGDWYN